MKIYSLYLAAFLGIITAAMSSESAKIPDALQVEILIFSGRPNPVFIITDPAEIREIISLAEALPQQTASVEKQQATYPKLGYNGIVVENMSTTLPDVQSFTVRRNDVRLVRKQKAQVQQAAAATAEPTSPERRSDNSAVLENRLLGIARGRGAIDELLLEHVKRSK